MRWELGRDNCLVIHLTLVPYLKAAKELKTKPTQHSVKELLSLGVQPDILACRTEYPLNTDIRRKMAQFCNVETSSVIEALDAESIYDVPLMLLRERLDSVVISKLHLRDTKEPNLHSWKTFLGKLKIRCTKPGSASSENTTNCRTRTNRSTKPSCTQAP